MTWLDAAEHLDRVMQAREAETERRRRQRLGAILAELPPPPVEGTDVRAILGMGPADHHDVDRVEVGSGGRWYGHCVCRWHSIGQRKPSQAESEVYAHIRETA